MNRPSRKKAVEWLENFLTSNGFNGDGSALREEVEAAAKDASISPTTLKRAADELKIVRTPVGRKVRWSLPEQRELLAVGREPAGQALEGGRA